MSDPQECYYLDKRERILQFYRETFFFECLESHLHQRAIKKVDGVTGKKNPKSKKYFSRRSMNNEAFNLVVFLLFLYTKTLSSFICICFLSVNVCCLIFNSTWISICVSLPCPDTPVHEKYMRCIFGSHFLFTHRYLIDTKDSEMRNRYQIGMYVVSLNYTVYIWG